MRGYWDIVRKEIVHLRRDAATLVFALMIPLVQLVIFGYAIDLDVRHIPTVVVDADRSRESREYLQRLRATGYLDLVRSAASPAEAATALRSNEARVAVLIPPDFARRRAAHEPAEVGVLIDGSDSSTALRARSAFAPPPGAPEVDARMNVLFNPSMRTEMFMVPGLIAVILQIVLVALTAFSLVRERESGTLEQLMVSPVGRLAIMLGKITPYAGLAFVEIGLVLAAGYLLFDVRLAGSLPLLLAFSLPFIVATLAIGLLISTLARTQAQALQMTMLVMLPSILLSGFAFPRETQPGALHLLSSVLPVTHYMNVVRGIVVRGASAAELWPSVAALTAIATTFVGLSVARFRKNMA